jgi:hypothetical protein
MVHRRQTGDSIVSNRKFAIGSVAVDSRSFLRFLAEMDDRRQADDTLEALIALETHLELTEMQVKEIAS